MRPRCLFASHTHSPCRVCPLVVQDLLWELLRRAGDSPALPACCYPLVAPFSAHGMCAVLLLCVGGHGETCPRASPTRSHWPPSTAGADFTNTFTLLRSFPTDPESPDLEQFLAELATQCATLEELRMAFRPRMDPRWVAACH